MSLPLAGLAGVATQGERILTMQNLHTGERTSSVYWAEGEYLQEGLADLNHLLRDHRRDESHAMDPQLLDQLYALQRQLGGGKTPFHVISGYRSPASNAQLRASSSGVAKRSLHMLGKAIDIRLPGHDLHRVHKAALQLRAGGVGYYPKSDFIHVDTGRVRSWRG